MDDLVQEFVCALLKKAHDTDDPECAEYLKASARIIKKMSESITEMYLVSEQILVKADLKSQLRPTQMPVKTRLNKLRRLS